MKYLMGLIEENGHKLVRFNEAKEGYEYMSVFNYCEKYGSTFDSFHYYNDYVVEIKTSQRRDGQKYATFNFGSPFTSCN